jgi:glycosyltransferase involved in cell wall biosynthesis
MTGATPTEQRPLGVLFLTSTLQLGGVEVIVRNLEGSLSRERVHATYAYLTSRGEVADAIEAAGGWVHHIGFPRGGFLSPGFAGSVRRLRALIRSTDVDVVHAFNFTASAVAALATVGMRAELISTRVQMTGWYRPWHRLANAFVNRRARFVTYNARAIYEGSPWESSIPARRMRVIPNAIDISQSTDESDDAKNFRSAHGIPQGHLLVGMVGNLRGVKNPALFVEVALRVCAQRDNVSFVMLGEGRERGSLESTIERAGRSQRVRLLGRIASPWPAYEAMDILALPSRSEGSPLVVMEAMGHGVPVVATRVGGVPELVTPGVTGELVESEDAEGLTASLLTLLDDPELRRRYGTAAQSRFEKEFSLATVALQYEQLYTDACAR